MSKQNGFSAVEILIAIVAVGLISFLGYQAYQNTNENEPRLSIASDKDLSGFEQDLTSILGLDVISERAIQEVPNSAVSGIELEADDANLVYVVHLNNGQTLVFNALTGERLEIDDNDNDEIDDDAVLPASFVTGVSLTEAIDIAKQQRPNSTLRKVEIEVEDGVLVFSVRFSDDSRVDVRAEDGEIQRLRDESGTDVIKRDDDFDDDGQDNNDDRDDDNDGTDDESDFDDDNDGLDDDDDDDDDNDGVEDDNDDDDDEKEDDDDNDDDRSGRA